MKPNTLVEVDVKIVKRISYFGQPVLVGCDARCDKAWGHQSRPRVDLDPNDDDDCMWLADDELGVAPQDPGTYEGGHGKPARPDDRLNKWCVRECERSFSVGLNGDPRCIYGSDYRKRVYNMPEKHEVKL